MTGAQTQPERQPPVMNEAWHTLNVDEVLERLETGRDGLTEEQAAARLEEHGPNTLPKSEPPSIGRIILHQFLSPLIYILLVAAFISIAIGDNKDAVFIFAVIFLNAGLGAFQEWRAERSAAALQEMMRIPATTRRGGRDHTMDAEALVPGDIVLLESGNRVPADLRLLRVREAALDESFLTGESEAAMKHTDPLLDPDVSEGDRLNMAFAGATVTSGRAEGVVVATGLRTQLGRIADATTHATAPKTPLVIRMEQFVKRISIIILGAVALLSVVSLIRGIPLVEVFFLAVALAVSAIPEGLPVSMTVALSIAMSRMSRRNVIVRKMPAVEGLGSCTFIASDKTGTLTVNRQTVKRAWIPPGEVFTVAGEGYQPEGRIAPFLEGPGEDVDGKAATVGDGGPDEVVPGIRALAQAAVVANEGRLMMEEGKWHHEGNAVDVALLVFGRKAGVDPDQIRTDADVLGEIPFESERQFSARLYRLDGQVHIAAKGAAERLLTLCHYVQTENGQAPIDRDAVAAEGERIAKEGYRVLAVAGGADIIAEDHPFDEEHLPPLTLLGLVGMIDPLRPEVRVAVDKCRTAGIDVAMVTGDHPSTALAIARDLGIASGEDEIATGRDLEEAGEPDSQGFLDRVNRAHVFARVSPLQKLHIVEALRRHGHFVAVTGDGVNDAPALRTANIGVAMGSGTDVAKDAASLIVTDDNFASIVDGVEEGRYAFDNIRKVIYLLISTGAAEIFLLLAAVAFGMPIPLRAVQLLWLNLVTNGIQDKALAFEGGEPGAMRRPPRRPNEGIFDRRMIQQVAISGFTIGIVSFALWYVLLDRGWEEDAARNMVLLLVVLFQNFHVFNARSEYVSVFRVPLSRNWLLVGGVAAALCVHVFAMNTPFLQSLLGTGPVSLSAFATLAALAASVLLVMEVFKIATCPRERRQPGPNARPVTLS